MDDAFAATLHMHECGKCGMIFAGQTHAERHINLAKCRGAAVLKRLCGIVKLGDDYVPSRKRQAWRSGPSTAVHGNHNSVVTIGHVDTLQIVIGNPTGDVMKAGSTLESELIRKTILENADLRRMVRTISNAPAAIFNMTKGAGGPQVLRNVKRDGRKACEIGGAGVETVGLLLYCKRTAVKMVDELQRAIDLVSDDSPPAVREWAADVSAAMRHKLFGNLDYVAALQLYCDASNKFYKLPDKARQAIAGGVRDIGRFIAETADF